MVTQYPDSAVYTITNTPVQDLSGNWYVPVSATTTVACRAEFNSKGGTLSVEDGKVIAYDYTLYMAAISVDIKPGTLVTLTKADGRVVETTVKRHENGQLNSKSWV